MMEGRRYSDGLHQALEAKEDVDGPAREPDAGLDHLPELFPPVSQAGRHDRHGDRPRRPSSPRSTSSTWSRSRPTCRCARKDEDDEVYRTARREVRGDRRADRGGARARPAGAGRHASHREVARLLSGAAQEEEHPAPGAERPLPRAGGRHRRPGRPAGRGHHRHQHGRPRHRHPARRQLRHAGPPRRPAPTEGEAYEAALAKHKAEVEAVRRGA